MEFRELSEAEGEMEKRLKTERRQKLFRIIEMILDGKINSSKTPLDIIFNQKSQRQKYISPKDRGSYNYGYMESSEVD